MIISAPPTRRQTSLGVNDDKYDGSHHLQCAVHRTASSIGGNADDEFGLMTTIHATLRSVTAGDGPHKDLRRARAAGATRADSLRPPKAIGLVMCQRALVALWVRSPHWLVTDSLRPTGQCRDQRGVQSRASSVHDAPSDII